MSRTICYSTEGDDCSRCTGSCIFRKPGQPVYVKNTIEDRVEQLESEVDKLKHELRQVKIDLAAEVERLEQYIQRSTPWPSTEPGH